MTRQFQILTGALLLMLMITPSHAALVSFLIDKNSKDPFGIGEDKTNNDCSGYFGSGFEDCQIAFGDTALSRVVIKFDKNLTIGSSDSAVNNQWYPTIDGKEWKFSGNNSNNQSGKWEYTAGAGDPVIKYWAAKAGPGFKLFWDVDDLDLCAVVNSLSCLSAANAVTAGSWVTPSGKGLSHLTFYDSMAVVPVPAAFWLFGTALIGLIGYSRRKTNA